MLMLLLMLMLMLIEEIDYLALMLRILQYSTIDCRLQLLTIDY